MSWHQISQGCLIRREEHFCTVARLFAHAANEPSTFDAMPSFAREIPRRELRSSGASISIGSQTPVCPPLQPVVALTLRDRRPSTAPAWLLMATLPTYPRRTRSGSRLDGYSSSHWESWRGGIEIFLSTDRKHCNQQSASKAKASIHSSPAVALNLLR